MKQDIILEQLEHISEEYIEEAKSAAALPRRRPRRALWAGIAAACLCLAVGVGVLVGNEGFGEEPGVTVPGNDQIAGELTFLQMGTSYTHAIIEIETITDELDKLDNDYQKVECKLIYSDELTDGTLYFPTQFASTLIEGQVLLAEVWCGAMTNRVPYSLDTGIITAAFFEDGYLAFSPKTGQLSSLDSLNSAVRYYLKYPNEEIPSIPKEEIKSGMTIEEVIAFLEGTEQALKEWQEATDWPWREWEGEKS